MYLSSVTKQAALGKMLLIIGLIIYTFITMLGGNPLGDRYGFRYWNDPGAFHCWTGLRVYGSWRGREPSTDHAKGV